MASKEELTDQLTLTTKLAAQVERMAAAAEKLDQSYQGQIDAVNKLAQAFGQINTSDTVGKLDALNKSLKDVQNKMNDTGKASEKAFAEMGKKALEVGEQFGKKLPKSIAVGAAAISGFLQGIRNVISLGKGVTGFFTSFVDGLVNVAASIAAIPFKIFSGLVDMAAKSAGGSNELAEAMEKLRETFGKFSGPANKAIIDTSVNLKGFSDTGLSAFRVFGTLAERLNYIRELATEMGGAFGQVTQELEDNGGAILAYQKGLGIAKEDMKGIAQAAISMGKKMGPTLKDMTKYSYELGDAFGLDAKLISRDMSKAFADVKHFAGATVKQIAEASTYARKLGLELKDITGTLDAFDTFDDAAENVAKLSQSFGVQVDAFKLMEAQSPAEQIDMLRKSFSKAGVDASNFNRQQLKLLSSTTGLDEATARQAFSLKNQGVGLEQIKKKGSEAEKKTLTQAEAMGKLADAIERMVKSGGAMEGGFWDMFVKGVKNGIMSSKEFYGLMRNIRVALMQVYQIGVKLGRVLVDIVPGFKDILGGLKEFFEPKYFAKLFQGVSTSVQKFFDPKSEDKGSIPKLIENLHEHIMDFFSVEGQHGKKILEGFKTFFKSAALVAASALKWLSDQVASGARTIVDLLTGKTKLDTTGAKSGVAGGLGFLADALKPIGEALKHAWTVLKDPLRDLVIVLGKKLLGFIKTDLLPLLKPAIPYLAATLFGPALGRSILASLTVTLVKNVLGGGGKSLLKKVASGFASQSEGTVGKLLMGTGKVAGGAALVGAAAAIGEGVNKYTQDITSTMDRNSALIAAGATGMINALTFGLLPPDLMKSIANTLGTVADDVFDGIKSVFGKGFGENIQRTIGSAFDVFGGVWSFFKELFTGDQASFGQAATELGLSLLRFATSALELTFIQLPIFMEKMAIKVTTLIGDIVVKLLGGVLQAGTKVIDSVLGTDLSSKVASASDTIRRTIDGLAKQATDGLEKQSDAVSAASKQFQSTVLTSAEGQAKEGQRQAAAQAVAVGDAAVNAAKNTKQQIDEVAASIKSLDAVKDASDVMQSLQKNISSVLNVLKGDATGGVTGALQAVSEMVKQTNELDAALGQVANIDIKTKLGQVASAVGLGGKVNYTVNPSRQVQININMTVEVNAADMEKALIMRGNSIIRNRLNFATNEPSAQASNKIPSTVTENFPIETTKQT